ncbi:acetyl-coenzyme A synthetase 2-like, mitochondrial [Bolinopsis microptera]|uniref:acetyl-coenzyme A synthetase 2-like, mitochondrial n=1 Tax=Bolinopsis microptera TaxID=2820187 RepID=UPI003079B406
MLHRAGHTARSLLSTVASAALSTDYPTLHQHSIESSDEFWNQIATERIYWREPYQTISDCNFKAGKVNWFTGGKLNVSENLLDRHLVEHSDKAAILWERDEPGQHEIVTYKALHEMTCRIANVLKSHGVSKGDRVGVYLPMCPTAAAVMLACARIGAIHNVVFAGFSAEALGKRLEQSEAKVAFTADRAIRGGKLIPLKSIMDEAAKMAPSVQKVFVMDRTGAVELTSSKDVSLESEMAGASSECAPVVLDSEDPLFMLYTSGSTGAPKGLVHTQAGYLTYAGYTHQQIFDYKPDDVYACVADVGWITGHSYVVYGPLSNAATTVMFESTPNYPDPGRYWETVERLKINQFYGAPTAVRLLMKSSDSYVTKYDRSSLRTLGTVGEPINPKAWQWYFDIVGEGRCPVVDTWWQTETGGIMIAPRPGLDPNNLTNLKPGAAMRPFYGVDIALMSPDTKENDLQIVVDLTPRATIVSPATPWSLRI